MFTDDGHGKLFPPHCIPPGRYMDWSCDRNQVHLQLIQTLKLIYSIHLHLDTERVLPKKIRLCVYWNCFHEIECWY